MADLIVHVVDASFEEKDFHIEVTEGVLSELGAADRESILAFNKIDLAPGFEPLGYGQDAVCISCKTGQGMEELLGLIKQKLFSDMQEVEMLVPYSRGDVVSAVLSKAKPAATEYRAEGTWIKVELNAEQRGRFAEFIQ